MGICQSIDPIKKERATLNNVKEPLPYDDDILKQATYKNTPLEQFSFNRCKIIKVYDGDTFWVAAWHNGIVQRFNIRLWGIDCPEMRGGTEETKTAAKKSKEYVEKLIGDKIVNIEVLSHKKINNKLVKEKWGRLLANINIDGVDLADEMIKLNLGKPYFGGKKT